MRIPAITCLAAACGGASSSTIVTPPPVPVPAAALPPAPVDESRFGPLEVGADFAGYRRVTEKPFLSRVHGNRWVHVYVNPIGADSYIAEKDVPVGTVVVKASWEDDHGKPASIAGPLFVMEKRAPGYAPEHGDWWYALHWADPPPEQRARFGGPVYWRGASPRVEYCWSCHDDYDRGLGGLAPSSVLPR